MATSAKPTGQRKAFKDYFDAGAADAFSAQIRTVMPQFNSAAFVRETCIDLGKLEFAGRVQRFSDVLATYLPQHIPSALEVLTASLPNPLLNCESVTDGWLQWPIGQYIADHGLPHFEASMDAMRALTTRFSSEFAVRPFVEKRPVETFKRLLEFTKDPNPHIRRWCSEGCRPRLPWGKKLHALVAEPEPIWPILEALKDDEELYVQKSVANNLNDIAKDHPNDVIARCRKWSKRAPPQRRFVIGRALRTLVKEGNPQALAVLGFRPPRDIRCVLEISPKSVKIGESIELRAALKSTTAVNQNLMLDYIIHHVRKNGKRSPKVFKWRQIALKSRCDLALQKSHPMRQTAIRVLYPGVHLVELQINGVCLANAEFTLEA